MVLPRETARWAAIGWPIRANATVMATVMANTMTAIAMDRAVRCSKAA